MIILGPLESFSILMRTGIPSMHLPGEQRSRILDAGLLFPPQDIAEDQDRVLSTPPSLPSEHLGRLRRLGVAPWMLAQDASGKVTALANSRNVRRKSAWMKCIVVSQTLARKSLLRIDDDIHILSPALCLIALAKRADISDADLAFAAFELCSHYAYANNEQRELIEVVPRTTTARILEYIASTTRINSRRPDGLKRVKRVLRHVRDGARTPLEAMTCMFLAWPQAQGGLHMPAFEMNAKIALDPLERVKTGRECAEVDFLWPEQRLILNCEAGVRHGQSAAYARVLRAKGYTIETLAEQTQREPSAYCDFMQQLKKPLGIMTTLDAEETAAQEAFCQRIIDIAAHRGVLRV